MPGPIDLLTPGVPLHGELHSADASSGLVVPAYTRDSDAAYKLRPTHRLIVPRASLITAPGGDGFMWFDDYANNSHDIVAATDGGTGEDSISIVGDHTEEFAATRLFTIAGSTANNGTYTSTGATYNRGNNRTTIAMATASLTDETGDGTVTANAHAIVAIDDVTGGEDTVAIAGDYAHKFRTGRSFTIAGSTANNGTYTSTGAAYDPTSDRTTINVATASWSDEAVNGDITANKPSAPLSGSTILRGTYAATGGHEATFALPFPRVGWPGEQVYVDNPSGVVDASYEATAQSVRAVQ